jgi:hypothetical protein
MKLTVKNIGPEMWTTYAIYKKKLAKVGNHSLGKNSPNPGSNFYNFRQIKLAFFSKTNVMIQILQNLALF